MTDLATLGIRVESQEVDQADKRLDGLQAGAIGAEAAVSRLEAAARGLGSAMTPVLSSIDASVRELVEMHRAQMAAAGATAAVQREAQEAAVAVSNMGREVQQASAAHVSFHANAKLAQSSMGGMAAEARNWGAAVQQADAHVAAYRQSLRSVGGELVQQDAHMVAYRSQLGRVGSGLKLTAQDGLNFSRQIADIGVTAAMGMNPLMIAVQQGPQLFDVMQQAAIRSGMTIRATMAATGAVIWTALAPILPIIAATALAVGAFAGVTALSARSMNTEFGDLTKGMGLTEKQLEKVQNKGVTMGDVIVGTLKWVGSSIWNIIGPSVSKIGEWFSQAMDWAADAVVKANKLVLGVFLGSFRAIKAIWSDLPKVMGDLAISAANAVVTAMETMINKALDLYNKALPAIKALMIGSGNLSGGMSLKVAQHVKLTPIDNPFAGAAADAGKVAGEAFAGGMADAAGYVDQTIQSLRDSIRDTAQNRIRKQAGEAGPARERSGGKSETERQIEETQRYIDALKEQAATLGMNAIQAKEYEIAQQALLAPTRELREELERAGVALVDKMRTEALDMKGKADQLEMIRREGTLIGASNRERAVAIAQLAEIQRLRNAGVDPASADGKKAVEAAGQNAGAQADNDTGVDRFNDSLRLTLDLARQADDLMRDAASGFADAFGDAGKAIGGVMTEMSGLNVLLADYAERKRQLQEMERNGIDTTERQAMLESERASATISAYGSMLGAAKGYFREGSSGYQVLQAAEAAFRAFQFAMSVQAMVQGAVETTATVAGAGIEVAAVVGAEAAKTGATVAGTAIRTPLKVAEGAAGMFAALGPFAFPVVAAMLAILASLGLKGGGGGGGGGAVKLDGPEQSTNAVRSFAAQDAQARDQSSSAIAAKVEVRVTADREGLHAYVAQTASDVAQPMVGQGMAAASGATRAQVMADLDKGRTYSRGKG